MMIPDFTGKLLEGRYELRRRIGHGGMATVYAAIDTQIDKPVAVKVLNPQFLHDADYIARFRQEAFSAAKIRHPRLVDVTGFGHDDGLAYFVMELLEGESLSDRLHRMPGPMPWREVVEIVAQVCDALAHAHAHGVIHRDIKPGNIFLVARPGRSGQVEAKLLDLGIAKVFRDALKLRAAAPETRLSQGTPGTPEYMAPEQAMGWEIDYRTDIYAVGVTLYRLLTGHLPFYSPHSAFEVQRMHVELPPVPLRLLAPDAKIPPALEAVVLRALAKRPDERFSSARELADALLEAHQDVVRVPVQVPADEERTTAYDRSAAERPLVQRVLSVSVVLAGFLTAATVFMLLMLFDMPFVKSLATWSRGQPKHELGVLVLDDKVFTGDDEGTKKVTARGPKTRAPVTEPAQEASEEAPIDLYGGAKPEAPKPIPDDGGAHAPAGPVSSPGPSLPQDPPGQAKKFVRDRLGPIAAKCKDKRTQVSTVFRVSYDLATGKIKVQPSIESNRGACVKRALESINGKKFGTGTSTFSVTVNV